MEQLDEVAAHRKQLAVLYAGGTPARPDRIAAHHDAIRHGLALAKIHATLADVQALHDLRSTVEATLAALPAGVSS